MTKKKVTLAKTAKPALEAEAPEAEAPEALTKYDVLLQIAKGKRNYIGSDPGAELHDEGFITVNSEDTDGDGVRCHVTENGMAALVQRGMWKDKEMDATKLYADDREAATAVDAATNGPVDAAAYDDTVVAGNGAAKRPVYVVENYAPAIGKRTRNGGVSLYPYDDLQVNTSFFLPATPERSEPWKLYSSLVAVARDRYAVPVLDDYGKPIVEVVKVRARRLKNGQMSVERTEVREKHTYPRDFKIVKAPANSDGNGYRKGDIGAYFVRIL